MRSAAQILAGISQELVVSSRARWNCKRSNKHCAARRSKIHLEAERDYCNCRPVRRPTLLQFRSEFRGDPIGASKIQTNIAAIQAAKADTPAAGISQRFAPDCATPISRIHSVVAADPAPDA